MTKGSQSASDSKCAHSSTISKTENPRQPHYSHVRYFVPEDFSIGIFEKFLWEDEDFEEIYARIAGVKGLKMSEGEPGSYECATALQYGCPYWTAIAQAPCVTCKVKIYKCSQGRGKSNIIR
jgi:hypothetical protein